MKDPETRQAAHKLKVKFRNQRIYNMADFASAYGFHSRLDHFQEKYCNWKGDFPGYRLASVMFEACRFVVLMSVNRKICFVPEKSGMINLLKKDGFKVLPRE